jgi:hypothetical protein
MAHTVDHDLLHNGKVDIEEVVEFAKKLVVKEYGVEGAKVELSREFVEGLGYSYRLMVNGSVWVGFTVEDLETSVEEITQWLVSEFPWTLEKLVETSK